MNKNIKLYKLLRFIILMLLLRKIMATLHFKSVSCLPLKCFNRKVNSYKLYKNNIYVDSLIGYNKYVEK